MEKVEINIMKNGPALIKGDVKVSKNGEELIVKEQFAICRCGKSKNQPMCDGTHKKCDFEG